MPDSTSPHESQPSHETVLIDVQAALDNLRAAETALQNQQPTDFWRQCVRDVSGRWQRYHDVSSRFGIKYFRGFQPMVNYYDEDQVRYLSASLETRREFYEGLGSVPTMNVDDFRSWLEYLRVAIQYRPTDEWLHQRFTTPAHDQVVKEQVLPIATILGDPYAAGTAKGPCFTDFPVEALPHDELEDDQIVHHYPTLEQADHYLAAALTQLQLLLVEPSLSREQYIAGVANFYQLLINLHYFAAMNASLYMNMANGLLEVAGLPGIENGIVDFVALRLQAVNFQRYFASEVERQIEIDALDAWLK